MRSAIITLLLFAGLGASAQHLLRFRVSSLPDYAPKDSIFLAGSFNGWRPGEESARVRSYVTDDEVQLRLPAGTYEYKVTRGSWATVESGPGGGDVPNRTLTVTKDSIVYLDVAGFKDHFPAKPKVSTAGPGVRIVDTAFYMPQLGRNRRIWVYLPPGYEASRHSYPVLYMHDGQNLFDDSSGFSGEWGVDEALDTLAGKWGGAIVVGIDHGGPTRINEYSPYDMERFGKGEGAAYVDFLVQTLKPWVDARYRTSRRPSETFTAGSSMGGLISMYALLRYPGVFGGAGVFSPAFWVAPDIQKDVLRQGSRVRGKIYFYAGARESDSMVPDMLRIFRLLHQLTRAPMETVIRAEGQHREADWRREFPLFYQWLMKRPPVRPMPKF
ncbi:MAG: hypothetical protein EOO11_01945 [Chitinophagaceae bacterium]|nr:MAG: hypothetical protein EOO11_01945 [Chitinophagaceae bacterium]